MRFPISYRRDSALSVALRLAAIAVLPVFCGCAHHASEPRLSLRSSDPVRMAPARDDSPQAPSTPGPEFMPLDVNVDATQTLPTDLKALQTALADMPLGQAELEAASSSVSSMSAKSGNLAGNPACLAWLLWGRLNGKRIPVSLVYPTALPANPIGVYAGGGAQSKTVCLVNRSQQKLQLHLRTHLPRGIYTIERLIWTPAPPATEGHDATDTATTVANGDANAAGNVSPAADVKSASSDPNGAFRLERLEGQDLKRSATIAKFGLIAPGQVVFYRFTDQGKIIDEAFADTYHRLALIESSHPGPAHRLRRMLREGDPYRSGVRSGDTESRLDSIQHLLLVVRQAQSLHHNYQNRGNVNGEAGAVLMGSLERLMDGLCEASATLLRLVPQVTVDPVVHPIGAVKPAAREDPKASHEAAGYQIVAVALANGGQHSVENVKLGVDNSELPSDVVCDPADPAFFGTLKPGQSVHATFRLRCPQGVAVIGRRCVADVCYHAGGGPAHLRPRPW